jgi:hypothetical protein
MDGRGQHRPRHHLRRALSGIGDNYPGIFVADSEFLSIFAGLTDLNNTNIEQ